MTNGLDILKFNWLSDQLAKCLVTEHDQGISMKMVNNLQYYFNRMHKLVSYRL